MINIHETTEDGTSGREAGTTRECIDIKIYNLFPRLYKSVDAWFPAVLKAKSMGFNYIYMNPFLKTGSTNSIYAINDYFAFDLQIFPGGSREDHMSELKKFLQQCSNAGMGVIFDLVINHSSTDSPLIALHRDWYQWAGQNEVRRASAHTASGELTIWEDCAKFDYSDKENGLWVYIESICRYYIELGFCGFRCDVAAQIPAHFWKYLIGRLREDYPNILFLGEAFLATRQQIMALAAAGFDYIFNSAKWWDYREAWFVEQNEFNRQFISSIAFPDNHDTLRLMEDVNGNISAYIQRLQLTAVISGGFMMTNGFEFGFRKKLDVHTTTAGDWEETGLDFTEAVRDALHMRASYPVFRQEGYLKILPSPHREALVLQKTVGRQMAFIFLNRCGSPIAIRKAELNALFNSEIWQRLGDWIQLEPYGIQFYVTSCIQKDISMPENETIFLLQPFSFIKSSYMLAPLQPGEAMVRICSCGICGSDYEEVRRGAFYWQPSYTGGHEFSAIVCAVKEPCEQLAVNDRVVYRIPREGTGIVQGGGYSRYAVVRSDCLFRLEPEDDLDIAVMIEPLAVAVHLGEAASEKISRGMRCAAIAGSGTVALLLERYLTLQYPQIRLVLFYKHKNICDYTASGTQCRDVGAFRECGCGKGGFDIAFECSGDVRNIPWLLEMVRKKGSVFLAGMYRQCADLNFADLMFQEKSLQGSFLYSEQDFAKAAALIRSNRIFVQDIMNIMPFEQYQNAFECPSGQRIKIVLRHGM